MERVEQLRDAIDGSAGVVLRLPENVLLATGHWPQLAGLGIAVVPRAGDPVLLVPEYEAREAAQTWPGEVRTFPVVRLDGPNTGAEIERTLGEIAAASGMAGQPIAIEDGFELLAPPAFLGETFALAGPTRALWQRAFATSELIDATDAIEALKAIKNDSDIAALERTNAIAVRGMDAFKRAARPGRTEIQVAAEVEQAIAEASGGAEARVARGFATVVSGPATAVGWQYFRSSDRVLQDGEWVMLELGVVVDGYWSDHTRTVVAGRPSDAQRDAFAAVRTALDAALAASRPGATGDEVDAAARRACTAAGFEQFPHHTGHGVGFRYHEGRPAIVPRSGDVLQAGMTIALEPGIYEEELGGVRWEDDAVVGADGCRLLGASDFGID